MSQANHEKYMRRALQLAALGQGSVSPNPMVGAVLVYQDKVIGEGWHKVYGGPHAEVVCMQSVRLENKAMIPHATMYVTLEPCHHFGKTPPCVDLLLRERIPTVVIAHEDPNPLTCGKSVAKLRQAGVEVITNVLGHEAQQLNQAFIHRIRTNSPFIILKWAQSTNGIMGDSSKRLLISEQATQRFVHQLRYQSDAILVGRRTALLDNPRLDTRYAAPKNFLRISFDPYAALPLDAHLLDDTQATWIFGPERQTKSRQQTLFLPLEKDTEGEASTLIHNLLQALQKDQKGILLVEGGAATLDLFLRADAWNRIVRITNDRMQYGDLYAPSLPTNTKKVKNQIIGSDLIEIFEKNA